MTLPRKHCHGVVENIGPSLYALIQPVRTMLLFVNGYRKGLAPTVVDCINDGNVELVRVLG